jgi:hypothetical protein
VIGIIRVESAAPFHLSSIVLYLYAISGQSLIYN